MPEEPFPPASRGLELFGISAMVLAVLELFLFGLIGFWRDRDGFLDSIYYHAAGRSFLEGENPYDPSILRAHSDGILKGKIARLYYPPQAAPLFMLLGLFSFQTGNLVLRAINVLAAALLSVMAVGCLRPTSRSPTDPAAPIPWLVPAMIVGNPWLVDSIWQGRVGPLVAACVMLGWRLAGDRRPVLAGLLLGLATVKPQFVIVHLVWLACERQWKVLAATGITSAGLMAYPVAILGPRSAIEGWLDNLRLHHDEWCNQLGWSHVMGARHLAFGAGIQLPDLSLVALALTLGLWFIRRRFRQEDVLGILSALSVTFMIAHDYDVVFLVPLLVSYWQHLAARPRAAAAALALAAPLLIPNQLVAQLHSDWAYQRSTLIVLLLLGWMIRLSLKHPGPLDSPGRGAKNPVDHPAQA